MSDNKKNAATDALRLFMELGKAQTALTDALSSAKALEQKTAAKLEPLKPEIKNFRDDATLALKKFDTGAFPGLVLRGQALAGKVQTALKGEVPVDEPKVSTEKAPGPVVLTSSATESLRQLKELRESDLITETEYLEKRATVIGNL